MRRLELYSLVPLLFVAHEQARATTITTDGAVISNETFDYIIVGAGLSGITVGNKLSSHGHQVLIIEAGPDPRDNPAVFNAEDRGNLNGYCNWRYPAYDENGEQLPWTIDSGACIGGSTSINGMVWYRPTEAEMNKLEEVGNPGWNWETLKPYMVAIERNIPPTEEQIADGASFDPYVHGYYGVINTSFPTPMRIPQGQRLYKQALPMVFPSLVVTSDLSARNASVSASTSWTIWYDSSRAENRRSSAADGLLWPDEQQRDTLTVLAEHRVHKVLFSNDTTATGVAFGTFNGSHSWEVHARREVILSAGTLGSAPILERSGIGRKEVLEAAGVECKVYLPGVGVNLCDQPGTGTSALVRDEYQNDTSLIDGRSLFAPVISLVDLPQLFGMATASSMEKSLLSSAAIEKKAEDLVNAGAAASVLAAKTILSAAIDLIVVSGQPVAEFIGESYPTVMTTVFWPLLPLSRGYIHITTADPSQPPWIVPRLLSDDLDETVAVAVARRSRDLFSSQPFQDVISDPYYDPSALGPDATDEEYLSWFKSTSFGASHWIGTTAMMPRERGGVVDPRLRVYGVARLRIVDAGILPFQITSHTMAALYSIAQRAADMILEDTDTA